MSAYQSEKSSLSSFSSNFINHFLGYWVGHPSWPTGVGADSGFVSSDCSPSSAIGSGAGNFWFDPVRDPVWIYFWNSFAPFARMGCPHSKGLGATPGQRCSDGKRGVGSVRGWMDWADWGSLYQWDCFDSTLEILKIFRICAMSHWTIN